jgi:hypothetical protein
VTTDATTFDSAAVTIAERPTGVVNIAGRDYEVRCPKLRVWMRMIERMEDYEGAQSLKPHIQELYRKLTQNPSDDERNKLIEQYSVLQPTYGQAPSALRLADEMLEFLCSCITDRSKADELRKSYADEEGGCDIPHLRLALEDMDEVFTAWLDEQSDVVGVKRPEPVERPEPVKRTGRQQSAQPKKTGGRATAKRVAAAAG